MHARTLPTLLALLAVALSAGAAVDTDVDAILKELREPTLEAVVAFYDSGAGTDPERDPALQPLGLGATDRQDLVQFLKSLTGDNVDQLAADARSVPIGDPSSTSRDG